MTTSRLPIPSLAELTYNVNKLSQPNIYLYHQLQPHHHPLSFQPSSSTVHHDYPPTPPQPPLAQRFCEPEPENDRLLLKQVNPVILIQYSVVLICIRYMNNVQ